GDQVISVKHLGGVVIGDSCKAADHVHVAHAVKIGYGALIAANACINGNVHIGDDAWIGPGSTLSNGITIGNHARISIGSVVTKDVGDGKTVSGNFAIDHEKFIDFVKSIR
ncbi:MAG: hypothetical protein LBN36_01820, partial [Clostridiales Family XIII bacterium]|nr:hypothetical protein [Clostridiales Family XIII bacterium]